MSTRIHADLAFVFGDTVYHRADDNNYPYIVTGILIQNNNVRYEVTRPFSVLYCYAEELTASPSYGKPPIQNP